MKKIDIITSGGDCGGLNAVIKDVAKAAVSFGMEAVITLKGYAGRYKVVEMDKLVSMTPERLARIETSVAGSEAGHSRVKIKKIEDPNKYERIKDGLKKFSLDGLIISGGDDTGSVMVNLDANGIPCIHVLKTMDLDLQSYSVRGDSAVNRISVFCRELKTTGLSHNRILAIEVAGTPGTRPSGAASGPRPTASSYPRYPWISTWSTSTMKRVLFSRVMASGMKAGDIRHSGCEGHD